MLLILSIYMIMASQCLLLADHHKNTIFFFFIIFYHFFSVYGLKGGSFLSVKNTDHILISPNGLFTAGFHQVGDNAYCFAVWFTDQATGEGRTVVWMANRDAPVNGKYSRLSLFKDGNLVLIDADQYINWSTHTKSSSSSVQLQLNSTGNLVLYEGEHVLWQSFDYPTDTLLPNQPFTKNTQLVSSRSSTNYSSGFYKLFFDLDSILCLRYEGPETTSVYWPYGSPTSADGRNQYQNSQTATLDSDGQFKSSDGFGFLSADFGIGPQRMTRMDTDGNLRVYSLIEDQRIKKWQVQWQAISHSCKIHGICGPNSLCSYSKDSGRRCTCLHGYKMVNFEDWSYGCAPEFEGCRPDDEGFIELPQVQFYGYDSGNHANYTLASCKKDCLNDCTCKGFQFSNNDCYMKTSLYNGYQMGFYDSMYIKLPKVFLPWYHPTTFKNSTFKCADGMGRSIIRSYQKIHDNKLLNFVVVLGCVIGFIEIIGIVFFWYKSGKHSVITQQCYFPAATAFRKFTYRELKKASRNFSEEIGRGGSAVVYKGMLSDNRIAAIKKLKNTNQQGEAEFQAEISIIGRLNHMNLIETWGYCAEGKHRLIVYEYMEKGSLAGNLRLGKLDWKTRFDIVTGTAKGLAYLHEECLEWILHCDVKPHNILLDSNYNPKLADFGLSKLYDRDRIKNSNFSKVRGTRGYMAPEWVFNRPITSKVDVFSFGVVILEMITGRSPVGKQQRSDENGDRESSLIEWVRDRINETNGTRAESWVEEIVNPSISGEYDRTSMENLVRIALQCANEDKKVRPSMKQVVNMLLHPENDQ
ncbi:hypothetical protein L2E82_46999 [Cichorium intybus]|uniref:Uncharacterized protein n=1 Tax=Cichorium intybus TaxID=13427 RepID=A0ACB8YVA7_CICIN|nr:hypothetical protein L2E82_46999 [Cichorium intybus]